VLDRLDKDHDGGWLIDIGRVSDPATRPSKWSDEKEDERRAMLAKVRSLVTLADSRLANTESRVAWLLARYPGCRESDTTLAIHYWERYQADVLEEWDRKSLDVLYSLDSFETISRIRRHIQNDLWLWIGTASTRKRRGASQTEIQDYIAAQKAGDSEIRVYVDESRGGGNSNYRAVAGVAVADTRQWHKHLAALSLWREKQGWVEPLHFCDIKDNRHLDRHLSLLSEVNKRRAGLIFLGYSARTRRVSGDDMVELFVHACTGVLEKLAEQNCLSEPRGFVLVKEAEEGWDAQYMIALRDELAAQLRDLYPGVVYLKEVETRPKGREVLLEVADTIVGGLQRLANYSGTTIKDQLAAAVLHTTGFDNPGDAGMVFKQFVK
jgi:hypothetical protein